MSINKLNNVILTNINNIIKKRITTVIDSSTKLLLHCDGTDGSTNITDSSPSGHNTTSVDGNAQLDTSKKKFGTASLLLDGDADRITYADNVDWNFGTGDFCIDVQINWTVTPIGVESYYVQFENGTKYIYIQSTATGIRVALNGSTYCSISYTFSSDTWYHIAVYRIGGNIYLAINGIIKCIDSISTDITISSTLYIGSAEDGSQNLNARLDEYRITKGLSRFPAVDFIPPTQPYGISEISKINNISI